MLVILCVLLSPGPSIEESAELATHLMYSASLPRTAASYIRYCTNLIYGEYFSEGEMSFQTSLRTRGRGKLYSAQPTVSVKRPTEMFSSTYSLTKALDSRRKLIFDPLHVDDRDGILSGLNPAHRQALNHFWETGILAPFSLDLRTFNCPNRYYLTPIFRFLLDQLKKSVCPGCCLHPKANGSVYPEMQILCRAGMFLLFDTQVFDTEWTLQAISWVASSSTSNPNFGSSHRGYRSTTSTSTSFNMTPAFSPKAYPLASFLHSPRRPLIALTSVI